MSGKDFQEETVLAAATTLKAVKSSADRVDFSEAFKQPETTSRNSTLANNQSGLEALFREHHDRVFRTAYRMTGSTADSEDVLQTVFLRVARGETSIGLAENPESYFARAAINASLDLLRSRKRARAVAIEDVENSAGVASLAAKENPATRQEDRELRELIREAVSKLGPTAAHMFALRYFEGYGNREIASVMKTSPLVVGVTLHRARMRLRKEIGRYMQRGA